MSVDTTPRGPNGTRRYYRCANKLCPRRTLIDCDVAEQFVVAETIRLAGDVSASASADEQLEAFRLRREEAERRLANAIETLAGLAGEEATRKVLDELQAARDQAVDEHERLVSLIVPDITVSAADWDLFTFDERRDVIRAVVARAIVSPGRGPDRITVEERTD